MAASRTLATVGGIALAACLVVPKPVWGDVGDLVADAVMGQSRLTDAVAVPIGPASFGTPRGIAIDRSVTPNRVYVSDSVYHRVLGWRNADGLVSGAPADLVIGQPDAFSWGCNEQLTYYGLPPAPTPTSLCGPTALDVDASGNLYVADTTNCRVVVFRDPFGTDTVADAVLGQSLGRGGCGVGPDKLYDPMGVALDATGNVFVADTQNCRVLEYDSPLTTDTVPDRVYGQDDFASADCTGANLVSPTGLAIDDHERLWVAEAYRFAEFDDALDDTVVDREFGPDDCNPDGETSSSMCGILALATDPTGRLYVADAGNSRVLEFDDPFTVSQASRVIGQPGFTGTADNFHDACNTGGLSAKSLCFRQVNLLTVGNTYVEAGAIRLDPAGRLWVADGLNDRVLRYDSPLTSRTADVVLGQAGMTDSEPPVFPLAGPQALMSESFVAVLEPENSRLLLFDKDAPASGYRTPFAVLGQPDFRTTGCNTGGASASSLCHPRALAIAGGTLWIADSGNNRVLAYRSWLTHDDAANRWVLRATADAVFGQPDFASTGCGAGASGLCEPRGVAFDVFRGPLYVADTGNDRILRYDDPLADAVADGVIGQADLSSTGCNRGGLGAGTLCAPEGLALDGDGGVYAADTGNNRVLLYPPGGAASATLVLGQPGPASGAAGAGATGLASPVGLSVDRRGNVYVADRDNNRVLEYDAPRTNDAVADRVFGQPDFASVGCGVSDHSLCAPTGVFEQTYYDDILAVSDAGNDRVVLYDSPFCVYDYELTPANRRDSTPRSKPLTTNLKLSPGAGTADDVLTFKGRMAVVEPDLDIRPYASPVLTLATPTGVVYRETVPDLRTVRSRGKTSRWGTVVLEGERDHGIDEFDLTQKLGGFPPRRSAKYAWQGRAVGLDLPALPIGPASWRLQYGGVCFTTELSCSTTRCKPAR